MRTFLIFASLTISGVAACGSSVDLVGDGTGGSPATVVTVASSASGTGGGDPEPDRRCQGHVDHWLAFGSPGRDDFDHMVLRPDGTIVVAGRTEGTVMTSSGMAIAEGRGGTDAFLMTLGPDLVPMEAEVFGDAADQGFADVALTPDGGIVLVGDTEGTVTFGGTPLTATGGRDIFVVKLDAQGELAWSHLFAGPGDDEALTVAVDVAGRITIGANITQELAVQAVTFASAGGSDVLLVQLDSHGALRWAHRYGDEGPQEVRDVDVFSDGGVVLTGTTNGHIDFGSGPLAKPFEGVFLSTFLAKLDVHGEVEWATDFESTRMVRGRTVVVDSQDDLITAGQFMDTVDFGGEVLTSAGGDDLYMMKLSAQGDFRWVRQWGSSIIQNLRSLTVSSSDTLLLSAPASAGVDWGCGTHEGVEGSPNAGFLQLEPNGATRFTHIVGDPPSPLPYAHQYGEQAFERPDGRVVALGAFHGEIELDGEAVSTFGSLDVFLSVVDAD